MSLKSELLPKNAKKKKNQQSFLLFYFSFSQQNLTSDSVVNQDEMTYLTEKLFRDYNKRAIPVVDGKPIEVKVKLGILDMVPKEQTKMVGRV